MVLFRLIRAFFSLLFLPFRLLARARACPNGAYLSVMIDGPVVDVAPQIPRAFSLIRPNRTVSLHTLAELVDIAIADPRVAGLVVTIKSFGGRGMATAVSLRRILARARDAGKDVVCYLPLGAATREVFIATGATRVLAAPRTTLSPLGFSVTTHYLRRALDKAGVLPEVYARGEYKSAGEQLIRESMSDENKEQLGALLDAFYTELVKGISEGRKCDEAKAKEIVDQAPHTTKDALACGLIDGEAYEDELASRVGGEGKPPAKLVDAGGYLARMKGARVRSPMPERICAVIPLHGPITHGGGPFTDTSTDERINRLIRIARKHPYVHAVILHVDSPGGSALASDRMHHELVQLAREKPLIACMANVAASGGYYVSAPAHAIVAESVTITGSIGVVGARFVAERLFDRIGISGETMSRGAHAGIMKPLAPLGDDERRAIDRELESTYQAFLEIVADGRKKSTEEVDGVARGRVWTGADAASRGLVDTLGGFDAALAEAKRIARDASLVPRLLRNPRRPVAVLDPPKQAARALARVAESVGLGKLATEIASIAALGSERVALFSEVAGAFVEDDAVTPFDEA